MHRPVRSFLSLAVLLMLVPVPLGAQQDATLQGTITDVQGRAIDGGSVQVPELGIGTLTDVDGGYTLSVPAGTHEVAVQALGYGRVTETVTLSAGQTETLNVTIEVSAVELEEVVASVEAGEVTRRQMGTDISSIDVSEQIETSVVSNVSELLNARAPNVTITQASGNVGAGSRIRIRGVNSLTQSNRPLFIIDGVRASNDTEVGINRGQTFSRFDDLDPNNIQSIQVVKGPSALALYGSEAASGVIIIETKTGRGSQDNMQVAVSHEQGAMWDVTDYPDNLADVTEFVSGPDDPKLDGWRVEEHPMTGQVFVVDNPYEDEATSPFRRGQTSQTSVQLSGRGDNVSYFTSLSYNDRTGMLPSNALNRLNFRANFNATPNDQFSVTASSGYISSEIDLPKSGNNTSGYFLNAVLGLPTSSQNAAGECLATRLTDGAVDPGFCDKDGNRRAGFDKIEPITSREDLERFVGSLSMDYTPFEWLTNSARLGVDVVDQVFNDAIPYDSDIPFSFAAGGEYFRTRDLRRNVTGDISSTVSYELSQTLGGRTAIGAQYFQDLTETIACEGRGFPNDQATACDAAVNLRGFSGLSEKVEIGAYAQQRVSHENYLFATGALRVDDNSALGSEEPAIWSPSFNTSLVVSEMPMWNVDAGLVSELRVRGAWGTASQSPPAYSADRTYGIVRLAQGSGIVPGLSPDAPGNAELGPERSSEIEVGFDAGVFDDRIGLRFTWFDRSTRDAIVPRPVPPSSGFAEEQFVNLGKLENRGYEASVNAALVSTDDVRWDATLTLSGTKATITELGDAEGFAGFREGYAPGSLTSCVITDAQRDANGDIIPESVEHLPGTLEDDSCLRVVGQVTPTNEQGLFTTVTLFDNLELSALFDRAAGHQLASGTLDFREPTTLTGVNSMMGRMWAYRQLNSTEIDQAYMYMDYFEGSHNAIWYQEADFIKFRELKVNYRLPRSYAAGFGAADARVYVGARNIATWTDFGGLDPELNGRGARDEIYTNDSGAHPPPFMVFSGLRVTF